MVSGGGFAQEEYEQDIFAATGAVAVHNPISNTRLGSGVAPIK